ncbi:MAG: hypothetical protein K8R54_16595 [Bacteroidales bacterium]|nr:hypothetical protein [Bacteroidales bacterium]
MKKAFTFFISILFLIGSISAQKTNDGGNTGGNDNNNDESCQNSCMNTVVNIAGAIFGEYHRNLLNSNDLSVTSLEIMLHGGAGTGNDITYYTALPRVKLNYGALSGDFRYSYSAFETGSSSFLDALLEFNIIAGNSFKMSLGQGIMFPIVENESNIFHESFIGMDIGVMDKMIMISPEFRLAYDWNISKPVNSEISLRGGYRIFGNSSFAIYANLAAGYQYMWPETTNTVIYGGFDIFIQ